MRAVILLLAVAATGTYGRGSCVGQCGVEDGSSGCYCNSVCTSVGDCCYDYIDVCMSCKDRCGEPHSSSKPCQCNKECPSYGNCCDDYEDQCEGWGLDAELRDLAEKMFAADVNAVGSQLTLNYQGKGNSGDLAPGPLFTLVPDSVLNGPTLSLLRKVQDNYEPSVTVTEKQDAAEVAEQNAFLDAITNTKVMHIAEDFLRNKDLISHGLRQTLEDIWFTLYSRKGGKLGSSGYEHVFIGELKGGKVSGFHNWLNFRKEELEGDLNYMGYMRVVDLNGKGKVIKLRFNWLNKPKPVGSIFVGTTPELEIALYTLCFLAKPNANCPVKLAGKKFSIQTWTSNISGKTVIGSAYPNI
ncbi:uridylate-specific endoribonuclease D-like isoform X7 [Panulirus ornatus]|uniref:uridylate-specific endoribonuclease D-like isoform X7 n=1 Tax=Panulirus ornatus TaxID=150431 RepID=UPI003A84F7E3